MTFSYLIDTNLLVLLTVGRASEAFIEKHKRTNAYTKDDFLLLNILLSEADKILVTPNVLTETSNLVRQFANPDLGLILTSFQQITEVATEEYVKSVDVIRRHEFIRFGLTDVALLAVQKDRVKLITDDLDLYIAGLSIGIDVVNFSHEREDFYRI